MENEEAEAASLYAKLGKIILPIFYNRSQDYAAVMRFAIAINGSFFNTQRMVSQYISNAYFQNSEF
jgi:starch phosphorylase